MKYSINKKSFLLQFVLYFSIALVLLGIGQSIMGSLRLYNASEQDYEKLSPEKIYTLPDVTLPEKTAAKTGSEKVLYYDVAENKNTLQNDSKDIIIKTESKKEEVISREKQTVKKENLRSEKKDNPEKVTSPVEISILPEEELAPKGYPETIQTVVTGKYFRDALWKFPIIIDTERVEPRGQMFNESITLGSSMKNLAEVSKVLVHEIGHMIDIYAFRKNLKRADPSEDFYRISWKDATTIKAGIPQKSFVSGYASTNQYEDFAESFTMYIFHNKEFLKRSEDNDYLKRKYNFLKTYVFGDAFIGSAHEQTTVPKKIWDVTKIAIRGNNIDVVFAWIRGYTS